MFAPLRSVLHRAPARAALVALIVSAGCAAPSEAPLDTRAVAAAVAARPVTLETMRQALELAALEPLAVPKPVLPAAGASGAPDYDAADFWHATAFVFDPATRAARRKLAAARGMSASAGAPQPAKLDVERIGNGAGREHEFVLTFDLLGILGLGKAAAAKDLATAAERAALADLESAVWAAGFTVDRARVRLAGALARAAFQEQILAEATADWPRIEKLTERGRIAGAEAGWAGTVFHRAQVLVANARAAVVAARGELARAAGLPPDAAPLFAVTPATLTRQLAAASDNATAAPGASATPNAGGDSAAADGLALLTRHPTLRAMRLRYGVAEAQVRAAAAERGIDLTLGPRLILRPSETLFGGVLDVAAAMPGTLDGRVAAAVEDREREREALEDALLAAQIMVAERTAMRSAARDAVQNHVDRGDAGGAAMWQAARARFALDTEKLEAWSFALEHRPEPALQRIDAHEALAVATLDLAEAGGVIEAAPAPARTSAPTPAPTPAQPTTPPTAPPETRP